MDDHPVPLATPGKGFINLLIRSRKLGLHRHPIHCAQLRFLEVDPTDTEMLEIVQESLAQAELDQILNPDPFRATNPVSGSELPGTIGIGLIPPAGVPWLILPEALTNHLLIAGRTGGGKTNLILLILAQILERRQNDQGV